ncbi:MAG: hypothetical protein ACE5JL_18120, partial [Dehalococcoidia bacterium]
PKGIIIESGAGVGRGWTRFMTGAADVAQWEELQRLHQEKLRSIRLPLLSIHGEWDELIPLERAIELQELVSSEPKKLVIMP